MNTIKCYESFLENDKNELGVEGFDYQENNPEPKSWNYEQTDESFNFEFCGNHKRRYTLKVFAQLECFVVSFPKGDFQWCAFSALTANRERFSNYEKNGVFYNWLVKRILWVDYKIHIEQGDWATLKNSDFEDDE